MSFCQELERAADECSFTDYDERACWQVSSAFSEPVLESATICAKKKCNLIIDCLDATMKVPSELDGAPLGFDNGEFSSGNAAHPASVSLFPDTTNVTVSPSASGTAASSPLFSDQAQTSESVSAASLPAENTAPIAPPPIPSAPPGIDIDDPAVRAQYCADAEACSDCRLGACCSETLICLTTESCVEWITCITDCPLEDNTCEDACRTTYAAGEKAAFDYIDCFTEATNATCASACEASDAGTTQALESTAAISVESPTTQSSAQSVATSDVAGPPTTDELSSRETSVESRELDASTPTCSECLNAECDPEVTACFADDPCYFVYSSYVYCLDTTTTDGEFSACFGPYYEYYLAYEPNSVALFEAMTDCINTADCAVCN
jgi:hypothetical protein